MAKDIAIARGISVESVKRSWIVESAAGQIRILSRDELNEHKRLLFRSQPRPRTLRRTIIVRCRSAAFLCSKSALRLHRRAEPGSGGTERSLPLMLADLP